MKKIIAFILFFFACIPLVYAESGYVVLKTGAVNVRKGPGTGYGTLGQLSSGSTYDLVDLNLFPDEGGCSAGWYKIQYGSSQAYICSSYATKFTRTTAEDNPEAKTQCEQELKNKGFPQSYWNGLCNLKVSYPNWNFEPVATNMDFAAVVDLESACGKNSIATSDSSKKDTSCTKKFDPGYYAPNQTTVAYYMNPTNFFTEKYIFMFESNRKNSNISDDDYLKATSAIFNGNYMVTALPFLPNAINAASAQTNVNQVTIASRIKQELGAGKATSDVYKGKLLSVISGDYTTRWGTRDTDGGSFDYYYNFFNVGAYDGSNVMLNAIKYAKRHGWGGTGNQQNDVTIAIAGGAKFISDNYTNKGQDTVYTQKFNVHPVGGNGVSSHQYMTNLEAPQSEASIIYNAYKKAGLLDRPFNFAIPVFGNVTSSIVNTPSGADGGGSNTTSTLETSTLVLGAGMKLAGNVVSGIGANQSVSDITSKIGSVGGNVQVFKNGKQIGDGKVGTGCVIKVSNASTTTEYTVMIKGDTSGDGVINALDLLQVQKNILGLYNLDNVFKTAGDTSGDGTINALDLLQVQKNILGLYNIEE